MKALTRLLEEYRLLSERVQAVGRIVDRVRDATSEKSGAVEEVAAAWKVELEALLSELDREAELLEEPIFSELEEEEEA